jgi:hypothetical protein
LDSFNLNGFYATEAALGFAMLAYNLMSLFRQAVIRTQTTLATLHHQVLAIGSYWNNNPNKHEWVLSIPGKRRTWFEGLWAKTGDLSSIPIPS